MDNPTRLPATPRGSSLESMVRAVAEIYARIEADQAAFLAGAAACGAALDCPSDCGSCCEPFVPDLLPAEAAFMAAWLLEREPALAAEAAAWTAAELPSLPPCPFMRSQGRGGRCSIYPARPLVCRLFGAAGVHDREGRASFRLCVHMPLAFIPPGGNENRSFTGTELVRLFGSEPPLMADYGASLAALSPSDVTHRQLIVEALPAALARVALSLSLAAR
jgi:uncharacterized protein